MKSPWQPVARRPVLLALCLSAGTAFAFLVVYALGITMAIAIPRAYFEWFSGFGWHGLGLFVLNLGLTHGFAVTLPGFVALFIIRRYLPNPSIQFAIAFASGFLATWYLAVPLIYITPFTATDPYSTIFNRPWYGYAFELSLLNAWGLAALMLRLLRSTDPHIKVQTGTGPSEG